MIIKEKSTIRHFIENVMYKPDLPVLVLKVGNIFRRFCWAERTTVPLCTGHPKWTNTQSRIFQAPLQLPYRLLAKGAVHYTAHTPHSQAILHLSFRHERRHRERLRRAWGGNTVKSHAGFESLESRVSPGTEVRCGTEPSGGRRPSLLAPSRALGHTLAPGTAPRRYLTTRPLNPSPPPLPSARPAP